MFAKIPISKMIFLKTRAFFLKIAFRLNVLYFKLAPKCQPPQEGVLIGLAGCGNFARYAYIPAFNRRSMPLTASGLYGNNQLNLNKTGQLLRYKTNFFNSYDSLLNSGIKGVILTLPNHLHYEHILKALNSRLDVFCEKPITNNINDAFRLSEILKNKDNILMVGFNQRYTDRAKKIKLMLDNKELGQIYEVNAFHNQNIAASLKKSSWLSDSTKSGGGILFNAGIHLVNLMLYYFGDIDSILANLESKELPQVFGEDTAYCDFSFKSGVKGRLSASYINEVDSSYEHIIIKGTKGWLYTDMKTSCIMAYMKNTSKWYNVPCKKEFIPDSVFNELSHFYYCIKNRAKPDTGIVDSINTLKVIETAYLSSKEKRRIRVNI